MRSRRVLPAVAVLSLLGVAGCGDDAPDEPAAAPAPAVSAGAAPAVTGSAGGPPSQQPGAADPGAPAPGASGPATSGPGAADPGTGAAPAPGVTPSRTGAPVPPPPARKPVQTGAAKPRQRPGFTADTLTAGGLGPYQEGASERQLRSADLLGAASTSECPGYVVAKGLGRFQTPTLVFRQGRLQYLRTSSATVSTSAGARVGMSAADVKKRYPGGRQLDDWVGATAWFATAGNDALLFRLTGGKVTSIEAGLAEPLQFRFTDGQGC